MQSLTILVPDERVSEFYQRFGEFMSERPAPTAATAKPVADRLPDWISEPGAAEKAADLMGRLKGNSELLMEFLIDAALKTPDRRFTPDEIEDVVKTGKGAHGVAGLFGYIGNEVTRVGLPKYVHADGLPWHFVWDWDRKAKLYWMAPEVAMLLDTAHSA